MILESPELVKNPLVSVRVLAYNHERFIGQCLESIVSQKTQFEFEIVIGEDCSKDSTFEICKRYQALYPNLIKLIHNDTNKGLVENFLNVNSVLRGKYVAACAGDDFWTDPFKLQRQVDILLQNEDVVTVFTNAMSVDENGNVLKDAFDIVPRNKSGSYTLHDFLRDRHSYMPLTILYKREAAEKTSTMYDSLKNPFLEDWTFWVCLGTVGNFYFFNKTTAAYRINPNSITHTCDTVNRWKEDFKIRKNLIKALPADYHKYFNNSQHTYFMLAMAYRKKSRYIRMGICFLCSFFCSPAKFVKELSKTLRIRNTAIK